MSSRKTRRARSYFSWICYATAASGLLRFCTKTTASLRLVQSGKTFFRTSMKPRVAIFFTGGTISMRVDPNTGGPIPALSGEEILSRIEGLEQLAQCEVINFSLLPEIGRAHV